MLPAPGCGLQSGACMRPHCPLHGQSPQLGCKGACGAFACRLAPVQRLETARLLLSLAACSAVMREQLAEDDSKRKELRRELNDLRIKLRRCTLLITPCLSEIIGLPPWAPCMDLTEGLQLICHQLWRMYGSWAFP